MDEELLREVRALREDIQKLEAKLGNIVFRELAAMVWCVVAVVIINWLFDHFR